MSEFVKRSLSQLVATLERGISSCDEERKILKEQLVESDRQRDSYIENKMLAEALLDVLSANEGVEPRISFSNEKRKQTIVGTTRPSSGRPDYPNLGGESGKNRRPKD